MNVYVEIKMYWYNCWWENGTVLLMADSPEHAKELARKEFGLKSENIAVGKSQSMLNATMLPGSPPLELVTDDIMQAVGPAELLEATITDMDVGLRDACTSPTLH